MSKYRRLVSVDVSAFIAVVISFFSGVVARFILPSLQGAGRFGTDPRGFLGLVRHQWMDVHFWSSLIFGLLVIWHLLEHWSWIKTVPRMLKRTAAAKGGESADRPASGDR